MTVVLMLVWDDMGAGTAERPPVAPLRACLPGLPGLRRALIHRPEGTDHDAPPPAMAVQIELSGLAALNAACAAGSPLHAAVDGPSPPRQQAFRLHRYGVGQPDPAAGCSYLVHYPGPARDPTAWLRHYADRHIPLMRRLPGIRGVEMLTGIDHRSALRGTRDAHLQRNRVSFDDPAALRAALASPVRAAMRADTADYPPYAGGIFHFVMRTEQVLPA